MILARTERIDRACRHSVLGTLTAREREVLALLACGMRNAELAARLSLSEATCANVSKPQSSPAVEEPH